VGIHKKTLQEEKRKGGRKKEKTKNGPGETQTDRLMQELDEIRRKHSIPLEGG